MTATRLSMSLAVALLAVAALLVASTLLPRARESRSEIFQEQ